MTNKALGTISSSAHIGTNAKLGSNLNIGPGVVIPDGAIVGNDVTIGPNTVFVTPSLTSTDQPAVVAEKVEVGANVVLYPGVRIAAGACILSGTVVTKSVPPKAIVEGNPAHIVGYVDALSESNSTNLTVGHGFDPVKKLHVNGVTLHHFSVIPDLRGNLTVGEFDRQIPFVPQRYFMVYGVPSREIRGEHAHRECHQFLICARGSCSVVVDDGVNRAEVDLDEPNKGIYLPPMTWGIQYKYSTDALLLVFASHHYDAKDYIRNYDEFITLINQGKS